ncbi:MAG: hypothetical protein KBG28_24805 [Kofleriaceae bacterium]|nr:hypothetical protein [Kofleriaceae bacterium]MBP9207212.1 hypothetical protein [Kofleriaceae bacterium]
MRRIIASLPGFVAGVVLVLSCSDDAPGSADAAACDCPAAEPPLPARVSVVETLTTIPAGGRAGNFAQCPAGAIVLTGGCTGVNIIQQPDVLLQYSIPGAPQAGWSCGWRNDSAVAAEVKVVAHCLNP